jgi:hypothetical protein
MFSGVYFTLVTVAFVFGGVDGYRGISNLSYITATIGEPWPIPQSINTFSERVSIHPDSFHFLYSETSQQCDVLTNAFVRYYKLIFFPETYWDDLLEQPLYKKKIFKKDIRKKLSNLRDTILLENLTVNIQQACEHWPTLQSNESCKLFKWIKIK